MKHFKVGLTFALVLAVLIIAFFGSVYLANKAKQSQQGLNIEPQIEGNIYKNSEFGFSLKLPEEWADYKTEQAEGEILFYLPTSDPNYIRQGQKYGALFNIIAIPIAEARAQDKKCAIPDPDRYWGECIGVINKIGENNSYRFAWNTADDKAADFQDESELVKSIVTNIKTFSPSPTAMRTFNKANEAFSLQYPVNMFTPNYEVDVPSPIVESSFRGIAEIELAHIINTKHCALSGVCTPTTTNMKFGVIVFPKDIYPTLVSLKKTSIGSELTNKTYGSNKAYILSQGVEGEGINYYFIENPNGGLLMVYYQYINENVLSEYKNVKDFIPYATQNRIVENVVASIKFTK